MPIPSGQDPQIHVPEVSLITSFDAVPQIEELHQAAIQPRPLSGLHKALQEGLGLLDLYFLSHSDIHWYADKARIYRPSKEPHQFVSDLTTPQLDRIAQELRKSLTASFAGRLVGRRPRFAAFATFFPQVSRSAMDDLPGVQNRAVRTLQNTLYLAGSLGCRYVEIVGGSGVPGLDSHSGVKPTDYRRARMDMLAKTLCEVYDFEAFEDGPPLAKLKADGRLPHIAVELEPSKPFLMRDLEAFTELWETVNSNFRSTYGSSCVMDFLGLNVDVAHAFLIGYSPTNLDTMHLNGSPLRNYVRHMHLSDHAGDEQWGGTHASDLPPGTYHSYEDYEPWLRLAIELTNDRSSTFSGVVTVEMEACRDTTEAVDAVNLTRQWLREAREQMCKERYTPKRRRSNLQHPRTEVSAALLVVDIGNSTSAVLTKQDGKSDPENLERFVAELCKVVHECGGSVLSFTGDGFVAVFEVMQFASDRDAAESAMLAAQEVCRRGVNQGEKSNSRRKQDRRRLVTVRAALHFGMVYVPPTGELREQAIGEHVVRTARICDWLGHTIEPSVAPRDRQALIAATGGLFDRLPNSIHVLTSRGKSVEFEKKNPSLWKLWGEVDCKGLTPENRVYIWKQPLFRRGRKKP